MPQVASPPQKVALPKGGHADFYERIQAYHQEVERCSRCVFDVNTPAIELDSDGVCNYCHIHDELESRFPTDEAGQRVLEDLVEAMRSTSGRSRYDCVVGRG